MKLRKIVGLMVFAVAVALVGSSDARADYTSTFTSPQDNFNCVDYVAVYGTTSYNWLLDSTPYQVNIEGYDGQGYDEDTWLSVTNFTGSCQWSGTFITTGMASGKITLMVTLYANDRVTELSTYTGWVSVTGNKW